MKLTLVQSVGAVALAITIHAVVIAAIEGRKPLVNQYQIATLGHGSVAVLNTANGMVAVCAAIDDFAKELLCYTAHSIGRSSEFADPTWPYARAGM